MSTFAIPVANNASGMPWPAGLYEVTLHELVEDDRPSRYGETPRVKWVFTVDKVIRVTPVTDQAANKENREKAKRALDESMTLVAWCNLSMNRKATMRAWIEALLGRQLANGEGCNPNDVIGRHAEATLEEYSGEDGTQKVKLTSLAPMVGEEAEAPF